jgi:hypothetical protein
MSAVGLQSARIAAPDRFFFTGMSIVCMLAVFVGFAPTYYFKAHFRNASLPPLVHLHGIVFTGWILLFFSQTVLVATDRVRIHRRLGVAGAIWAVLVVVVGLATAAAFVRRNLPTGGSRALAFLATPVGDMLVFAILTIAGVLYRRRPAVHKRLMLIATISLLGAAVSRWPLAFVQGGPLAFFFVTDLFLLPGMGYDLLRQHRIHPAYLCGGSLLVASQPLRHVVGQTHIWQAFARLLTQ